MINSVDARPLTRREHAVLEALLAVVVGNVESLRRQAAEVAVVGVCGCGCPSIDFHHDHGLAMTIRANATVPGTHDGLFLYTIQDPQLGEVLGGIEWIGIDHTSPQEFPPPEQLDIRPA
jgi:hypothetical protein